MICGCAHTRKQSGLLSQTQQFFCSFLWLAYEMYQLNVVGTAVGCHHDTIPPQSDGMVHRVVNDERDQQYKHQ